MRRCEEPITVLKGIGAKTADIFKKAGIETLEDLIEYFPRDYKRFDEPEGWPQAADGSTVAACGFLENVPTGRYVKKMNILTGRIRTPEGILPVTWFNMPYLKNSLKPGIRYVFRGEIKKKGNTKTLTQPQVFTPEEYEKKMKSLQPVYPLVSGLTMNMLTKAVYAAMEYCGDFEKDYLPEEIRQKYELSEYGFAVSQIHFPEDEHAVRLAHRRLAFDEFFLFILAVRSLKENRVAATHSYTLDHSELTDQVLSSLPYQLTDAQSKVWAQIEQEMKKETVMARLVQGDVGSGKTIIAFLACIMAAGNGSQSALMVPTEVLANQHYEAFVSLAREAGIDVPCVLLTGSMKASEKKAAYKKIESGEAKVIIGTHALIQEKVVYQKLVLVVTDEQHRFGVKQREALAYKGELPHTLVMSATPIPRTLAVILYGDLDVCVIDQMPVGRLPIKNCVVGTSWRPKAYAFIKNEVNAGHQAYVICPMVEESEMMEAENVTDYTEKLRDALPASIHVEMLHGKMSPDEKDEIMKRFASGETHVLVSTTVIEVGVNVPNATVMMIEDANRFGLAQLHQLRGRVGRGSAQSYCIMINTSESKSAQERLDILNKSNDGFEIAQKDLELRGPGDLFGIRQSGILDFKVADVFQDAPIMQNASEAADDLLSKDAELTDISHIYLRQKLQRYTNGSVNNINI